MTVNKRTIQANCSFAILEPSSQVFKGTWRWSHTWLRVVVTTHRWSSGPVMTSEWAVNKAIQHPVCQLSTFLREYTFYCQNTDVTSCHLHT